MELGLGSIYQLNEGAGRKNIPIKREGRVGERISQLTERGGV